MTSATISHFPTRWFVNNISSSTTCFSNMEVISNLLQYFIMLCYYTLCKTLAIFLIFMKKLCLWLFNLSRYAKWREARQFYDTRAEKQINCVTGNTFFQSKMSLNAFKLEIYILKWVKNHHCTCFHITRNESSKSNWGLGVHLTPLKYVKPRPTGKTFGWVDKWYAEWS